MSLASLIIAGQREHGQHDGTCHGVRKGPLKTACQECKASTTFKYVDLICQFECLYGGGEGFSLIKTGGNPSSLDGWVKGS